MAVHKERFRRPVPAEPGAPVRPVFEDFHRLRMDGNFEYPRHQHLNYEVILVERGPYRCELNGAELSLAPGRVLVIKPGDWHQDHLRHGQRHYVLHFRLAGAVAGVPPVPLFREGVAPAAQVCRGSYARQAWIMRELRDEARQGARHAGAVQDGLLEALFWRIVRGLAPEALSPGWRQLPAAAARQEEIAAVFGRHLADNPAVPALAAELGVSARHLVNRCRALFGEPPARLLLRFKLRRAGELLRYRGLRVREVSDALGFANPYHFSRVYRRHFGRPPSRR